MKLLSTLVALIAAMSTASAQVPVGPFTGQLREGFETSSAFGTSCVSNGIFDGTAQLCTPGGLGCVVASVWSYWCTTVPRAGSRLFGSAQGHLEITFQSQTIRFGGWFATAAGSPDASIEFYAADGGLVGSVVAAIPADCQWHWNGWSLPAAAKRVVIVGNPANQGAEVLLDEMQTDYAGPNAIAYCTAGTTTNGCVPSMAATVNPDLAHSNGCRISVSGVDGLRSGIVFYGLAPNALPWCSFSSSHLCVQFPIQRTGTQSSGGTFGACDGSLMLDWNVWQSGNVALGQPFVAGSRTYVQAWFRDPPACKTTSTTDALELTYLP